MFSLPRPPFAFIEEHTQKKGSENLFSQLYRDATACKKLPFKF